MALLAFGLSGCGMASMVETNTRSIQATTDMMKVATGTIQDSNHVLRDAQGSLDRLARLREPMEKVAGLEDSMKRLADLKESMDQMRHSMEETTRLKESIDRLSAMQAPLVGMNESLLGIRGPMERVAALDAPMRDVADLKQPMERVANLHAPMQEISKLEQPMVAVSQMGNGSSRQTGVVVGGVLLAWGLVTFLGVHFGVQTAQRRLERVARRVDTEDTPPARSSARLLSTKRSFEREPDAKQI